MGIIKLAAHNANREDKIRLRNALQKLDEAGKKVETDAEINAYLNADYELHEEIARITHNTILMELHASLREGILSLAEVWKRFANLVDIVNPTHGKIVDAIARNVRKKLRRRWTSISAIWSTESNSTVRLAAESGTVRIP